MTQASVHTNTLLLGTLESKVKYYIQMLRGRDVHFGRNILNELHKHPEKLEWGKRAAVCPLQEKPTNNKLGIGERQEKLISVMSMEVVGTTKQKAIIATLWDEVDTRANVAEQ